MGLSFLKAPADLALLDARREADNRVAELVREV